MKKLALSILPLVILSGCWRGSSWNDPNQSRTHMATKPDTAVAFDEAQARFFDEDIEAFVLEEDTAGFDAVILANNETHINDQLAWEEPDTFDEGFQTVYFDYDKAGLTTAEREKLKENIEIAKNLTDQTIVIKGHSCKKGKATENYKMALSNNRAEQIAQEFEKEGISRDRLKVFGTGSTEATIDPSLGNEATAPDRRVEIYTLTI